MLVDEIISDLPSAAKRALKAKKRIEKEIAKNGN